MVLQELLREIEYMTNTGEKVDLHFLDRKGTLLRHPNGAILKYSKDRNIFTIGCSKREVIHGWRLLWHILFILVTIPFGVPPLIGRENENPSTWEYIFLSPNNITLLSCESKRLEIRLLSQENQDMIIKIRFMTRNMFEMFVARVSL
jgi:hypothetical protein